MDTPSWETRRSRAGKPARKRSAAPKKQTAAQRLTPGQKAAATRRRNAATAASERKTAAAASEKRASVSARKSAETRARRNGSAPSESAAIGTPAVATSRKQKVEKPPTLPPNVPLVSRGTGRLELGFDQAALFAVLDAVCRAASKRTSVQVLTGVLLSASKKALRLVATDMEIAASGEVPAAAVPGCSGKAWQAVAVPAAKLRDAVKQFGPGEIGVGLDGESVTIWRGSRSLRLPTGVIDDYPRIEEPAEVVGTIDGAAFLEVWGQVRRCFSRDESRPVLTGVRVEVAKGQLRLAATDSYRLAVAATGALPAKPGFTAIVPGRALLEVARLAKQGDLEVRAGGVRVSFTVDGVTVSSRVIEGTFPDVEQLRPDYGYDRLVLPRKPALDAAAAIAKQSTRNAPAVIAVSWKRKKPTVSFAFSESAGVAIEEELEDVEVSGFDTPMQIGVSPHFLADALASFAGSETVTLQAISPLRPMLVSDGRPDECWQILMPIKISS